jgi:hypothetical protein
MNEESGHYIKIPESMMDFFNAPPVLELDKAKAIGWFSPFGSELLNGYYWADCPDCDEECAFSPEGEPTQVHRGKGGDNA